MNSTIYNFSNVIDYIQLHSHSNDLDYHWFHHLMDVKCAVAQAMRYFGFDHYHREVAELAALFHDINHLGQPDIYRDEKEKTNIDYAIETYLCFACANGYATQTNELVTMYIRWSAYPYNTVENISFYESLDMAKQLMIDIFRESDLLQSLMFYDGIQVAESFAKERSMSLDEAVKGQLYFVPNLKKETWYPKTKRWIGIYEHYMPLVLETLQSYKSTQENWHIAFV